MTDATLVNPGSIGRRPAVRLERRLPDPPEVVWQALTDRARLADWFPSDVEVAGGQWVVGVAITFVFPAEVIDMTLTGHVVEVDAPHRLAYTWGDDLLRFELSPEGDGTHLVLTDELPASWAARNAAGWDECLDRLVGRTVPDGAWRPRFEAYSAAFEPALGPQDGPPADHPEA
jgi:uncharacterized protein YndB with AHSA1/START domain